MSARLKLRKLHAGQRSVGRRAQRFNTLRCGRRWGKTEFGLDRLILPPHGAISGKPTAWFAPTYKYLAEVWNEALKLFEPVIQSKDKQLRVIRLVNGAHIDFWSLEDEDAGRGRKYAHVVVDESTKVRKLKDAWEKAIRPTLTDYRGSADFLATPKGRDFFFELCQRGIWVKRVGDVDVECLPTDEGARPVVANPDGTPVFPDFASFHEPTSANPFIPADELVAVKLELPDLVFRQEYLAEFVDFQGTVIKREWLRYGDPLEKWKEEQLVTCLGGDLAASVKQHADYCAAVVLSKDPDGYYWVRYAERARLSFRDQMRFFAHLGLIWQTRAVYIEEVAYQAVAVQELLLTTSLNIRGYKPDKDKFRRFLPLQPRFQRGMIILDEHLHPGFEGELLSFSGTKEDKHDDYIDALAMAYVACNENTLDQPMAGGGARLSVAGAAVTDDEWPSVRVIPR